MNRFDFTITTDEGYTYRPFTNGHAVGFIATAPNGKREFLFLNPSGATDDGFADIAVYHGEVDEDVTVDADGYIDDDAIFDSEAQLFFCPFDVDTTADALARLDLATMSIGAEPTAEELSLRTAEYVGRLKRDKEQDGPLDFMARDRRASHDVGVLLDLQLTASWLRLYGVPAEVEHTGGNNALLTVAGGKVNLGPGWFEGTAANWRAFAGTDDAYLTTDDDDPTSSVRVCWTELETAWMAINMLTGRPVFTYHGLRREVAKPVPLGAPITA